MLKELREKNYKKCKSFTLSIQEHLAEEEGYAS